MSFSVVLGSNYPMSILVTIFKILAILIVIVLSVTPYICQKYLHSLWERSEPQGIIQQLSFWIETQKIDSNAVSKAELRFVKTVEALLMGLMYALLLDVVLIAMFGLIGSALQEGW